MCPKQSWLYDKQEEKIEKGISVADLGQKHNKPLKLVISKQYLNQSSGLHGHFPALKPLGQYYDYTWFIAGKKQGFLLSCPISNF